VWPLTPGGAIFPGQGKLFTLRGGGRARKKAARTTCSLRNYSAAGDRDRGGWHLRGGGLEYWNPLTSSLSKPDGVPERTFTPFPEDEWVPYMNPQGDTDFHHKNRLGNTARKGVARYSQYGHITPYRKVFGFGEKKDPSGLRRNEAGGRSQKELSTTIQGGEEGWNHLHQCWVMVTGEELQRPSLITHSSAVYPGDKKTAFR